MLNICDRLQSDKDGWCFTCSGHLKRQGAWTGFNPSKILMQRKHCPITMRIAQVTESAGHDA